MSKTFRAWDVDQVWLLPPSVHDFVPAGHPAHLVRELVRTRAGPGGDHGALRTGGARSAALPPGDDGGLAALCLHARRLRLAADRQGLRGAARHHGGDRPAAAGLPHHSDFRKRHLEALAALFVQVLRLCRQAGLVGLGHVALDGTRLKANASKHKAMSYGRMKAAEAALAAEVKGWLAQAAAADAAEDAELGPDRRGDELPGLGRRPAGAARAYPGGQSALWRPRPRPTHRPRTPSRARPRAWSITAGRRALRTAVRRRGRSAISPIPTVGCSRPGMATSRAITARSRSTASTRSSPPSA